MKATAKTDWVISHRMCCKLADEHPDFLDMFFDAIKRQQQEKPKSPDDLRRIVLAKRAALGK